LEIIKLIIFDFDPETKYIELKKYIERIKEDIKELNSIKSSLLIFHRKTYNEVIKNISININDMKIKDLNYYKSESTQLIIKDLKSHNVTATYVEKVKDFLLFKVLYNEAFGIDQEKRFNEATKKLDEIQKSFNENIAVKDIYENNKGIFNKIKEMLSNNESKADGFIGQIKKYFNIGENKDLVEKLSLLFKSKMYEMVLKSIIYFFKNLNFPQDKEDNFITNIPDISKIEDLEILKKNLNDLKDKYHIYDYQKPKENYKFFTSLYEKKEAIDFLLAKIKESDVEKNIKNLYDRIDPTNRTITINNIDDTKRCIQIFVEFRKLKNYKEIFKYITTGLKEDDIQKFERYSKNYSSIIELDRNDDSSLNLYKEVNEYIQDANFNFRQDKEDFTYGEEGKATNMEDLIHLKNQINFQPKNKKI